MQSASVKFTVGAVIAALLLCGTCAFAANSSIPPYKSSGGIPGTALLYDGLAIDNKGTVTIVISNPGRAGESFVANFSFHSAKGDYLTGFSIDGFAGRMSSTAYTLALPNYRNMRRAAYMKVLGRSGRLSE